jgi:hypothetical protein
VRCRLLNLLTALSLLLCVAVCVLWVRSYAVGQRFHVARFLDSGRWTYWVRDELRVWSGRVGFSHAVSSGPLGTYRAFVEKNAPGPKESQAYYRQLQLGDVPIQLGSKPRSCLGFEMGRSSYVRSDGSVCLARDSVIAPLWSVAALAGVMPALWCVLVFRNRSRRLAGLCPTCNYDLRATPARCPECGESVAT